MRKRTAPLGASVAPDAARWLAPLLERYRRVVANGGPRAEALVAGFNTLRLADALLDKAALNEALPGLPPQLTLLGPTQSGKSTLANLLLDTDAAGVSALAGYTVHATGLATGCDEATLERLGTVLAPRRREPREALSPERLDAFALDRVEIGPRALLERAVVWDTPDFDSVESGGYRGAVLQGSASGDVLVLVVSKDKYGDRTVWDMLALLQGLGRPLVICLNKLDAADEATVTRAFSTRFEERFGTPPERLVTLPFVRGAARDRAPTLPDEVRERLGGALESAIGAVDHARQAAAAHDFVARHRDDWLAPLGHELAAAATWDALVAAALDEAEAEYVRLYLDDPVRYDTFNRALAELLTLLELPGVAQALARTREIVTWPARTLLGIGRRRLGSLGAGMGLGTGERTPPADQEAEVLARVLERLMTRLQGELIERREEEDVQSDWWRAAHRAFRAEREDIARRFEVRGSEVRRDFEPRIEEAARRLHERLRQQPALLATLRTARATTDAAGIALAVKSGGLAPTDLVLAPAMLSVTTLLTESALGRYLDAVRRELQAEQRALTRRELLEGVLGESLSRLARELDDDALLGVGLDPEIARLFADDAVAANGRGDEAPSGTAAS